MKKFLRIICYSLLGFFLLIAAIILFLFLHYNSLEKKIIKTESSLKQPQGSIILRSGDESNKTQLNLLPQPHKVIFSEGTFAFPPTMTFSVSDSLKDAAGKYLGEISGVRFISTSGAGAITFRYSKSIPEQGYNLVVRPSGLTIDYSSRQGLFYSVVTLKVLNQNYKGKIPCITVEDYPDLAVRGLMFDISRNKIPKRETLHKIASLLADLKYNHMELYVEGFSFAYPSFKELWEKTETPVTGDDIKALDSFCREHFIDLVPNQNMFGHMMSWLGTDKFRNLAECPNGFKFMGLIDMKGTLDPSDPGSIELVTRMADDILPNFSSGYFNVNMDETFDLGKGKSKKICEEKGEGNVYFDYAMKVHQLVTERNKKMLMWGDIVLKHPEIINRIPKDVTLLDWGYESLFPFEKNATKLQEAGVNFMVCPGTSSWSSFVGRNDNMIANIRNAVTSGVKHHAIGMLLTDWGDLGHWQYLPVSYAGYCVGSTLSWSSNELDLNLLTRFLSSYMFRDEADIMGKLALNLGKYPIYEEKPGFSMTNTMMAFQTGLRDEVLVEAIFDKMIKGITELMNETAPELASGFVGQFTNRHAFNYKGMYALLDSAELILPTSRMRGDDSLLIRDEYSNALRILRLGIDLQYYIQNRRNLSIEKQKELLSEMKVTGSKYLEENRRLWMIRNNSGGYESSIKVLNTLMMDIDKRIQLLGKPVISRSINRFFEKVTSAAAAIYIKNA